MLRKWCVCVCASACAHFFTFLCNAGPKKKPRRQPQVSRQNDSKPTQHDRKDPYYSTASKADASQLSKRAKQHISRT